MAPLAKNGGPQKKSWTAVAIASLFLMGFLVAGAFGSVADSGNTSSASTDTTTVSPSDPSDTSSTSTTTDATSTSTPQTNTTSTSMSTSTETTPPTTTSSTMATTESSSTFTPTMSSDKTDYAPGSTVTLMGNGWGAGEVVHIFVNDDIGQTWSYSADVTADGTGSFTNQFQLPSSFVAVYSATATGAAAETAVATFTDGNLAIALATADQASPAPATFVLNYHSFGGVTSCAGTGTAQQSGQPAGTPAAPPFNIGIGNSASAQLDSAVASGYTFAYFSATATSTTPLPSTCIAGGNGQLGTVYVHFKPTDSTPPVITPNISGVTGTNGWYTSNASLTWTVTDPETTITSTSGCGPQSVVTDTTGMSFTCSATSAGGTNSQTVTIKRDATAPTVGFTFGRTADHNGWYTSPVQISGSGTDATSGIANCTSTQYSGPDSATASATRSCTDNAGNTASASTNFKYDSTGPSANLSVTAGTPGTNGWYTSNVTVSTSGADTVSRPVSCTPDQTQTTETSGVVLGGSCTNDAGLTTAAAPLTIKLDKTAPSAALVVTAGDLGWTGWYTSDVTVHTSGADSISVPITCTADQLQTTETAGAVFNGSCTNDAGLSVNAAPLTVKLDKTGPSATLSVEDGTLGNNGFYVTDVRVGTSGSDTLSGPVTCTPAQFQTADTAGQAFNGSCTNGAGLTTNAEPLTVKRDTTAPSVTAKFGRAADNNGWFNHPVLVSGDGADATSGIASCESSTYSGPDSATATQTRSCTDNAGNTGSATSMFKYDATVPSAVLSTARGTPGMNGWYISDVTVHTSGADSVSDPVTCSADQVQSSDTAGTAFHGTCTNDAGLSTDAAPLTIKLDETGPTTAQAVTAGTPGANGWYVGDVTVHASGGDPTSGPVICTGDQFQTTETTGAVFHSACTNQAGLSTDSAPLTIKLDKTGPSASLSASGTKGMNGWFTSDVTVSTSGDDTISGPVSCTGDQFQTLETTGAAFNGTCTNDAGLTTPAAPLTVKVDKTGPSASLAVTAGTPGANGWYTSDATVSTNGADSISGPVHCTADQVQTSETSGTDFHGSCTNDAGLSTDAALLTVKLDKTAPTAALSVSAGTLGDNGWYTSDVTVHTSGADSISGPVTCSPDQFQHGETTGQEFRGMCVNDAGLAANAAPLTVKLDKTGPSASLAASGAHGANGWFTGDVTISTSGADDISAPVHCTEDQFQTSETSGTDFHGSCTNDAGLSTDASALKVKLDKTGPSASLAASGTHGANGWFTGDVTISASGADDLSAPVHCTGDQFQTSETSGTDFQGSCTNDAGLSTDAAPLTVKLDKTGPSATLAVTDGTLGDNGWYVTDVTVRTSGADSISAPVMCTGDQFQTTDTVGTDFHGTCTNDAGLSTDSPPLAVKRDTTPPSVTIKFGRPADHNGWYTGAVDISGVGSDATSRIATCESSSYGGPDDAGAAATRSCTDNAGNTGSATGGFKYDSTAPSTALSVTGGAPGMNGWYTSDVTVHASGDDSVSDPVTCTADQDQTTETTGQVFNATCTNDAGLSSDAAPLTVKLDKTGPAANLSVTAGTLGSHGWYTSDVTVQSGGSDTISGPVICTSAQYQTTETTGTNFHGTCTNQAGLNTDAAPLTVKLDKTPPSAGLAVTAGTPGAHGWYTSNVTVSTSGSDSISSPLTCSSDQSQTVETTGAVFNGTCTNDAGLTASSAPLTVKLDKTGPSANLSVTGGALGHNGWYTSNVTVHAGGTDSISAPVSCTADQLQTTETAGSPFTGSCTNDAGLTTSAAPLTIKLDRTPPAIASANEDQTYTLNSAQTVSFSCSDPGTLSGVGTCIGTLINGGALPTAPAGSHSYSVTATDNAGNSSSRTVSYSVSDKFSGFLPPLNSDSSVVNVGNAGRTYPIKWQLTDANGNYVTDAVPNTTIAVAKIGCMTGLPTDTIDYTASAGGTALRYDSTANQYVYNWATPSAKSACYKMTVTTPDGLPHVALFQLN
jgi:hypothetical protein